MKSEGKQEKPQIDEQKPHELPVLDIQPPAQMVRYQLDEVQLEPLVHSIESQGVLEPVLIRRVEDHWECVAGMRRCVAAVKAGVDVVPVRVVEADDTEAVLIALIENEERQDMVPFEIVATLKILTDKCGMTHDEVATRMGKSRSWVSHMLSLDKLCTHVQSMVDSGRISARDATALVAIEDEDRQREAAQQIIQYGLKGDAARQHVKRMLVMAPIATPPPRRGEEDAPAKVPRKRCDLCNAEVHPDLVQWLKVCSGCIKNYIHPLKGEG